MDFSKYLNLIVETEKKYNFGLWENFGADFGVKTYYADYVKAGFRFKPKSIMEIGVRFGYSGMAMVYGSGLAGVKDIAFTGIDDEGYIKGSNEEAENHFKNNFPECKFEIYKLNTVWYGLPEEVTQKTYDMVHVDGNHSIDGALSDMNLSWQVVNPGGVMIVDDCTFFDVGQAIKKFKPDGVKESFETANERGQKYYIKK